MSILYLTAVVMLISILVQTAPTAIEVNANSTNSDIVYGDILLTPVQRARINAATNGGIAHRAIIRDRGSNRWPRNVVPYEISSIYSSYELACHQQRLLT